MEVFKRHSPKAGEAGSVFSETPVPPEGERVSTADLDALPAFLTKKSPRETDTSTRSKQRLRRVWYWRLTFFALRWGAVATVFFVTLLAALVAGYSYFGDDPLQAGLSKSPAKLTILADDGKVIAEKGMRRNHVTVAQMPPHLVKAVMATEDRRFYSHFGVDPRGILRAFVTNARAGRTVQGGSTITQQLAKVLFLKPDRTYQRKIEEVLLALSLEYRLEKNQIIELYLNRIYFGAGNYGVEAAAQHYFGKPVSGLTLYESAIMAGLIKSPNYYAPTTDMQRALNRGKVVLDLMIENEFITQAEYKKALANPPTLRTYLPSESYGYVIDWVAQSLADLDLNSQEDMVVETTINYEMQGVAQGIVKDNMAQHGAQYNAGQAAAVILDLQGEVKALAGGRDYTKSQYNHVVQAKRQPGSTFKPFVYLTGLEKGLTPDSTVHDGPLQIGDWVPENYNNRYSGDVTLRQALSQSMNTATVRLSEWAGRDNVIKTAHRMGIASPLAPNASIALGTSEVSLLEMTSAYVPLANGGFSAQPHIIRSVRDAHGQPLFTLGRTNWGQVVRPEHVAAMNDMLVTTIETGTGHQASLEPHVAAGKTGTTQSYRDAWFIGYTGYYVTGVWIGNDDFTPMQRVTGGGLPTLIWRDLMLYAHVNKPPLPLPGADHAHQVADGGGDNIGEEIVAGGKSLFDTVIGGIFGSDSGADVGPSSPSTTGSTGSGAGGTKPPAGAAQRGKKSWLEDLFE